MYFILLCSLLYSILLYSLLYLLYFSPPPPPPALPPGACQRHRTGRRPELRLRQQQRRAPPGCRGRGIREAGRGQSARGQQQQVQHLLWVYPVPRLKEHFVYHVDQFQHNTFL